MSLRARLNQQVTTLLQRLPDAAEPGSIRPPIDEPAAAREAVTPHPPSLGLASLACWRCGGYAQPCGLADCPKVWRLKDAPNFPNEGEWKKEARK